MFSKKVIVTILTLSTLGSSSLAMAQPDWDDHDARRGGPQPQWNHPRGPHDDYRRGYDHRRDFGPEPR
ncbi:MAG: hypothetical protein QM666_07655, partial [Acinetobacter sp.]